MMEPLAPEDIDAALQELDGWSFENDRLSKQFVFEDFRTAIAFIVRLAFEAEEMNHHPSLHNVYNQVDVALNTHDVGGKVTKKDVALAQKIDSL